MGERVTLLPLERYLLLSSVSKEKKFFFDLWICGDNTKRIRQFSLFPCRQNKPTEIFELTDPIYLSFLLIPIKDVDLFYYALKLMYAYQFVKDNVIVRILWGEFLIATVTNTSTETASSQNWFAEKDRKNVYFQFQCVI